MAWIFTPIAAGRNALRLVFAGNVFQARTGPVKVFPRNRTALAKYIEPWV